MQTQTPSQTSTKPIVDATADTQPRKRMPLSRSVQLMVQLALLSAQETN